MTAQAHSGGTNSTCAVVQRSQVVNCQLVVLIVRLQRLLDLVLVARVGSRNIVSQWLGADKVVVNRRSNHNVAPTSNLLSHSRHRAGHLVDLRVHQYSGNLALGYPGIEGVYTNSRRVVPYEVLTSW